MTDFDDRKTQDPGRTPGQAEGTDGPGQEETSDRETQDPGRTSGQAEGLDEEEEDG